MNKKKLLFPAFLLTATLALASCSEGSRNTSVPYGNLDANKTIASSDNGKDITLSLNTYYNKLRNAGYNLVVDQIKTSLYTDYIKAVNDLIFKDYQSLSEAEKKALSYSDKAITSDRFDELQEKYIKSLSDSLANSIISTTTYEGYIDLKPTEDDSNYEKAVYKYIQSQNKLGYDLDSTYITFSQDANDEDHILLDLNKFNEKASGIVDSYILDYAEDFYVGNKLYEIANEEYIYTDDEKTTKSKNQFYLFRDEKVESTFDTYFKTYGTYNAVIISFASRKEAMETIKDIFGSQDYDIKSLDDYLKLYNHYYKANQKNNEEFVISDDVFNFTVDKDNTGFSGLDSSVKSLITDTLKDGEFLTEPRNISGNYVLVYRNSTIYEASGNSTQYKYADLTDDLKAAYKERIENKLIEDSIASYSTTSFKELLKKSNLKIYDPIFETKFYNSYTDQYTLIDKNDFNKDLIFKLNDTEYKVDDFYQLASKRLGLSIINEYFEQVYASKYVEDYVDSDTQSSNSTTLKNAIEAWKKGENSTYAKTIGLENFLVANYGWATEDEVLKYYYNAKSALSTYLGKTIFDEWAVKDEENESLYTMSDDARNLMSQLLQTGNSTYSKIFSVNIDHILISIDFDNDGTPDDPAKYLVKHPELEDEFKAAVSALAKAIYAEATQEAYEGNSLYSILSYISAQYVKGASLRAGDVNGDGVNDTWDDYKTIFRFSLKAEQLSSSSDVTQSSVSNFVVPFADYVKELYAKAKETNPTIDKSYGVFFTPTDGVLKNAEDVSKVSIDTLCETVYGYHLLVLNSYSGADSLVYSAEKDDPNGYQAQIKLLIKEDTDNSDNNIYITINSYNEDSSDAATINQLFIYYIESQRGSSTSLDSKINTMLKTLFSDTISTYTSSNFQTLVLLDEIKIKSDDATISSMLNVNREYLVDVICNYGENDDLYASWCDVSNHAIFVRPNQK